MKKLAKELNVHFLVRGTVARSGDAYKVTVVSIDGDSERVLKTSSLTVAANELTPHWRDEVLDVVYDLTSAGLKAEVKRARDKPLDSLDVRDLAFRASVDWRANRDADGSRQMPMPTNFSPGRLRWHPTINLPCAPWL